MRALLENLGMIAAIIVACLLFLLLILAWPAAIVLVAMILRGGCK